MKILIKQKASVHLSFLVILGFLFFIPFLGRVHLFDWDEINFAECAREMIVTGNYSLVQINFEPFWEKPPLFFWLQVFFFKIFGVNEFSARLPNAVIGVITLATIYLIGKKEQGKSFGLIWGILYFGSLLPHLYFKSGIIDPVFNYFIFLSIYFMHRSVNQQNDKTYAILSGVCNGLAVVTKGPVGLLLFGLCFIAFLVLKKFKPFPGWKALLLFGIFFMSTTFLWYGPEIIKNGWWFLDEFIRYQTDLFINPVAGHEQPFYYHFVVVLIGCFPMSVFALMGFKKQNDSEDIKKLMLSLFWVVMILFSIVTTKIVHYSSMAYLPLSFLAAHYLNKLVSANESPKKIILYGYLLLGCLISILITVIPIIPHIKERLIPYINDPFAVASLNTNVIWNGWEVLIGLFLLCSVGMVFVWLKKKQVFKAIIFSGVSMAIALMLVQAILLPKIEKHVQGPAIDFYKSLKGKDVYVYSFGFKSYAPYFYFEQPLYIKPESKNESWLLSGKIDKPVFFICKITDKGLTTFPEVEHLKDEGGFSFYQRLPQ